MLDLQLNGYKGVDFNADDLTLDAMRRACAAVRADGGGRMLATIITDRLDGMNVRISRLAHGVPVGGELDYLDEGTLSAALRSRTPF